MKKKSYSLLEKNFCVIKGKIGKIMLKKKVGEKIINRIHR